MLIYRLIGGVVGLAVLALAPSASATLPTYVYAPSMTKIKNDNPEDDSNCVGG